jgi:hypothetical protein
MRLIFALAFVIISVFSAVGREGYLGCFQKTFFYVSEGKRYLVPFNSEKQEYADAVINSWGFCRDSAKTLSQVETDNLALAGNLTMRPGTYTIKRSGDTCFYAVEYDNVLRKITPEANKLIYSDSWKNCVSIPDVFLTDYVLLSNEHEIQAVSVTDPFSTIRAPTDVPQGCLFDVSEPGSDFLMCQLVGAWYLRVITDQGIRANFFNKKFFIQRPYGWSGKGIGSSHPINDYLPEYDFFQKKYVNPETINNINGGLGVDYSAVSFEWHTDRAPMPANVKVGSRIKVIYDDGSIKEEAVAVIQQSAVVANMQFLEVQFSRYLPYYTYIYNYRFEIVAQTTPIIPDKTKINNAHYNSSLNMGLGKVYDLRGRLCSGGLSKKMAASGIMISGYGNKIYKSSSVR